MAYADGKPLPISPQVQELRSSSSVGRPRRRSVSYIWRRLGDWWAPELISVATALTLFGVYLKLLRDFDGKPVTSWETNSGLISSLFVTLPSAISFLTTIMRAAIGLPVASAMGQLKWHQYHRRPRHLTEFDTYDSASRGVTGSLSFLLSRNFWSPASIGCVIIVTGLFFGPFLQNTVEPEQRWLPVRDGSERATLPVIANYASVTTKSTAEDNTDFLVAPVEVQAALGRGWFFGTSLQSLEGIGEELQKVLYTAECSTGNCTWSDVSSLRLVHRCVPAQFDVEDDALPDTGAPRQVAVSRQALLSTRRPHPRVENATMFTNLNMRQRRSVPAASSFAEQESSMAILAHVGIMGDFNSDGSFFEAIECIFYWAAVRASANFTNGVLAETHKETFSTVEDGGAPPAEDDFRDVSIRAPWVCSFNATTSSGSGSSSDSNNNEDSSSDSCVYTVTRDAQHGLYNSLRPYLNGWSAKFTDAGSLNSTREDEVPDTLMRHSSLQTDTLYWGWTEMAARDVFLMETANLFFSNLDFFATATLRMTSLERHTSFGVAQAENVFFKVNAQYILLPAIMLGLSVFFFLGVALWTRKGNAWRNSQLPLLYHGLESAGPRYWELTKMAEMWEAAGATEVQMSSGKDGGELRLQRWGGDGVEYWRRNGSV